MLRNGRTGHTWHLVVDHIMLVMKMRSSSPANRHAKRIYVLVQKKWLFTAGCLQRLEKAGCQWLLSKKKLKNCFFSVDLLNDYMHFFTGLYCTADNQLNVKPRLSVDFRMQHFRFHKEDAINVNKKYLFRIY